MYKLHESHEKTVTYITPYRDIYHGCPTCLTV